MSVYNDYMVKATSAFVAYAELYCKLLSLGKDDCCLKNKLNITAMYLDTLPRVASGNCLSDTQIMAITEHINDIWGYPGWGNLTGDDIISQTTINNGTIVIASLPVEAWNVTIGTTPYDIVFTQALGATGSDWAMTYYAVNQSNQDVSSDLIFTNRTNGGFTVTAPEENVHFEGHAIPIS